MVRPDIFGFTDLIFFLKVYFEYLRSEDQKFTIRRWAARMGLSSPTPLLGILRNQRDLRIKDLDFLLKGLDLSPEEISFFEPLLMLKRAKDEREKASLKRFLHLMRTDQRANKISGSTAPQSVFIAENEELFSHWVDAAVLSALELKSAREDLNLLRENLLWETDTEQVNRSLEKIKKLGLIAPEKNQPKFDNFTTRSDHSHRGARAYFSQINQIATEAITLPLAEREFQCFSIPAYVEEMPAFKQIIREFRDKLSRLSSKNGNIIYQFNLEMFPLTRPIRNREYSSQISDAQQ